MRAVSLRWIGSLVVCLSIAVTGCGDDKKRGDGERKPYVGPIEMTWDADRVKDKDQPDQGYVFNPPDVEVDAGVPVRWINKKVGDRLMFHTATHRSQPGQEPRFRVTAAAIDGQVTDPVIFTD